MVYDLCCLKISFLRMVYSWEGDTGFPHQKELHELLDVLPQEVETQPIKRQLPVSIATTSPSASPKVPHKSRKLPWKKQGKHIPEMPSLDDDEETPKKTAITLLASVTPEVTKSQKYQQECIKRLGDLFQENEDVLVVPLGYSSIESPGMLSEEKVGSKYCWEYIFFFAFLLSSLSHFLSTYCLRYLVRRNPKLKTKRSHNQALPNHLDQEQALTNSLNCFMKCLLKKT